MATIDKMIGQSMNSFEVEIKRNIMRSKYLTLIALLTLTLSSCEELERVNPNDPLYKLEAPTNLELLIINDSEINISWTDNSEHEAGFHIERDSGAGFVEMITVSEDVTECTDSSLDYGADYTYRIAGFTANNASDWVVSGSLNTIISAPSNLFAIATSESEVELTWTDNCSFELGFMIERDSGSGFEIIAEVGPNVSAYYNRALLFNGTYRYRIQAFSRTQHSVYSDMITVTTNVMPDIDGNLYKVIEIGEQVWMAENLKVTHYRNGDPISRVTEDNVWGNMTSGAFGAYQNDTVNIETYGLLYNWNAVNDTRDLAPEGWHVATDNDWKDLELFLGMRGSDVDLSGGVFRGSSEGSKLAGMSGIWEDDDLVADGEFGTTGFVALPAGVRDANFGSFHNLGTLSSFWTATDYGSYNFAWNRIIYSSYTNIFRSNSDYSNGCSVRCVRD